MSCASSPAINPHSFYLETCGCAKNSVDSENLIALLTENGMCRRDRPEEAAILIVNTCGFIDPAKEESIGIFTGLRENYPDRKLIVTGCLAERYADELSKTGAADLFIGNRSVKAVAEAVLRMAGVENACVGDPLYYERRFFLSGPRSVYVKIAEGCGNFCTFCAIPLIRGAVRSRKEESILAEVKALAADGVFEINLVAQDLTVYGQDLGSEKYSTAAFERLLKSLDGVEGNFKIRLLYMHPDHITDSLLKLIAESQKILHYFDIPFQHVSFPVLQKMGRKGTRKSYTNLIEKIRQLMPDAVIRSTLMAGFPGERERDAAAVADFLKEVCLDWVGFFVYSREEGTAAAAYRGKIAQRLVRRKAERRKQRWESVQQAVTSQKMKSYLGSELTVLIEEVFPEGTMAIGRTWFQAPEVDGCVVVKGGLPKPGELWYCRIDGANGPDLEAEGLRLWML